MEVPPDESHILPLLFFQITLYRMHAVNGAYVFILSDVPHLVMYAKTNDRYFLFHYHSRHIHTRHCSFSDILDTIPVRAILLDCSPLWIQNDMATLTGWRALASYTLSFRL